MACPLREEVRRLQTMLRRSGKLPPATVRALAALLGSARELLQLHLEKSARRHRQVVSFREHRAPVQAAIQRYSLTERQLRFLNRWRDSPLFLRLVESVGQLRASSRKVQAWAARLREAERDGPLEAGTAHRMLARLCAEMNST